MLRQLHDSHYSPLRSLHQQLEQPKHQGEQILQSIPSLSHFLYRTPMNMFDSQCNLEAVPPANLNYIDLVNNTIDFSG